MSKIGRKPISLDSVKVDINNNVIAYRGKNKTGEYALPACLQAEVVDNLLYIKVVPDATAARKEVRSLWGLHRASLANALSGATKEFEKQLRIVGLGFKAISMGSNKLQFALGYSHKIDFELPTDVKVDIDKTGQLLTCKSSNKELLGEICSKIHALRKPEPYKGTGVLYANKIIRRKAGKAKAAA